MPIRIGDYDYDYVDGDPTELSRVSKPKKSYPLDGDSSVFRLEEEFQIFTDFYEPLNPGDKHYDYENVFFSSDSPLTDVGGGVAQFTRRWISLPGMDTTGKAKSYVTIDFESYVMTVPGINPQESQQLYQLNYIASATQNGDVLTIRSTSAHDVEANKGVVINYWVKDPLNGYTYSRSVYRKALPGTGGIFLYVSRINDINTPIFTNGSFKRADGTQEPYNRTVSSKLVTDYWLPGVTRNCNSSDDIPIIDEFRIIGSTGNRTDYLSDITTPTLDEYLAKVNNKEWMPIEPSQIHKWEGGPVYQRTTRYVRAKL